MSSFLLWLVTPILVPLATVISVTIIERQTWQLHFHCLAQTGLFSRSSSFPPSVDRAPPSEVHFAPF